VIKTKQDEFWDIPGIGEFQIRSIITLLGVPPSQIYRAQAKHQQTGKISHLWEKILWLMVYDQDPLKVVSGLVNQDELSVRHVREKVLGIKLGEFATLLCMRKTQVIHLEHEERRNRSGTSGRHCQLLNIILKLLSVQEHQSVTINRLLHLARFKATTPDEQAAVCRLRKLLLSPSQT
jgi:hypothetical protein